jgi:hypothetical protein
MSKNSANRAQQSSSFFDFEFPAGQQNQSVSPVDYNDDKSPMVQNSYVQNGPIQHSSAPLKVSTNPQPKHDDVDLFNYSLPQSHNNSNVQTPIRQAQTTGGQSGGSFNYQPNPGPGAFQLTPTTSQLGQNQAKINTNSKPAQSNDLDAWGDLF